MESLKTIRKTLGFSQAELADMLGISRSHYSMAEIGLRSRTPGVTEILDNFSKSLSISELLGDPFMEDEISMVSEKQRSRCQRELAIGRIRCAQMQSQLDKMKKDNASSSRSALLLSSLCNVIPSSAYRDRLLQRKEEKAALYLSTLPPHQKRLELEIRCLLTRLATLEEMLSTWDDPPFSE